MAGIGEGKLAQKAKRQGIIGYAIDYWKDKASKTKSEIVPTAEERGGIGNRGARKQLRRLEGENY